MTEKKARKLETLLGQCLLRAALPIAEASKIDLNAKRGQKLKAMKLAARAVPKGSRVAAFVVEWAIALNEIEGDELTLTEFQRWANESERTAWRRLAEFRELFTEYETPTPLAEQILRQLRRRNLSTTAAMNLPVTV